MGLAPEGAQLIDSSLSTEVVEATISLELPAQETNRFPPWCVGAGAVWRLCSLVLGVSLQEVCDAAGGSFPHTLIGFKTYFWASLLGPRLFCLCCARLISHKTGTGHYGGVGIDVPIASISTQREFP